MPIPTGASIEARLRVTEKAYATLELMLRTRYVRDAWGDGPLHAALWAVRRWVNMLRAQQDDLFGPEEEVECYAFDSFDDLKSRDMADRARHWRAAVAAAADACFSLHDMYRDECGSDERDALAIALRALPSGMGFARQEEGFVLDQGGGSIMAA